MRNYHRQTVKSVKRLPKFKRLGPSYTEMKWQIQHLQSEIKKRPQRELVIFIKRKKKGVYTGTTTWHVCVGCFGTGEKEEN